MENSKNDIARIIDNFKKYLTTEKIQELLPKIKGIVSYNIEPFLPGIEYVEYKIYCSGNCFRDTSKGKLCIKHIERLVEQLKPDNRLLIFDKLNSLSYNFGDCYYFKICKNSNLCLTCLFNVIDKRDLQNIIMGEITIEIPPPKKLNPYQKYCKNYTPPDTSTVLKPMLYRKLKSGWITVGDSGVETSFTLVNDIPNELREFKFSEDIIHKSYRCSYCHFIYNNKHAFTSSFDNNILYCCITCFLKNTDKHIKFFDHHNYIPSCNNMSFNTMRKFRKKPLKKTSKSRSKKTSKRSSKSRSRSISKHRCRSTSKRTFKRPSKKTSKRRSRK